MAPAKGLVRAASTRKTVVSNNSSSKTPNKNPSNTLSLTTVKTITPPCTVAKRTKSQCQSLLINNYSKEKEKEEADDESNQLYSDDIDMIVEQMREKYKKRSETCLIKTRKETQKALDLAIDTMKSRVEEYEDHQIQQLQSLKDNLCQVQSQRDKQVQLFRRRFKEMKKSMSSLLQKIEIQSRQHDDLLIRFLESMQASFPSSR